MAVSSHDRVEQIPRFTALHDHRWLRYLIDTVLAVGSMLLVSGLLVNSHLYSLVHNALVLYLIVILALTVWRGTYASIIAALSGSLFLDYFLIPPYFQLSIATWAGWAELLLFLLVSLSISWLVSQMRRNAEQARLREQEAHILYELMRVANDADTLDEQLDIVVLSIERVFSQWGLKACALLLPDKEQQLVVRADAPINVEPFRLSEHVRLQAEQVMRSGQMIDESLAINGKTSSRLLLLPLSEHNQVLGVLCLYLEGRLYPASINSTQVTDNSEAGYRSAFFWAFLDQATSLVERALLRERAISSSS